MMPQTYESRLFIRGDIHCFGFTVKHVSAWSSSASLDQRSTVQFTALPAACGYISLMSAGRCKQMVHQGFNILLESLTMLPVMFQPVAMLTEH